jgi:predicted DNA-binding protein with PD1-like motif
MQIATTAAAEACGSEHGEEVLAQLKELNEKARVLVAQAEAAGDARTALLGIRELKGLLELQARLTGQLELKSQHNSLHLHLSPDRAAAIAQTYLMRHSIVERPH